MRYYFGFLKLNIGGYQFHFFSGFIKRSKVCIPEYTVVPRKFTPLHEITHSTVVRIYTQCFSTLRPVKECLLEKHYSIIMKLTIFMHSIVQRIYIQVYRSLMRLRIEFLHQEWHRIQVWALNRTNNLTKQ